METIERVLQRSTPDAAYIPGLSEVENFYTAIGMGSGPFAPASRAVFNFGVVWGIQRLAGGRYAPWAYDENDNARPYLYFLDKDASPEEQANATVFPWFFLPGGAAIIGGLFL
jgi:hypothetical protein